MKKIVNVAVVIMFSLAASVTVHAQRGDTKFNLNYNYSMPIGSFKNDIISDGSPRGATGDIMYNFSNKISGGIGFGYQDYYQKYPRTTYKTGDNETTSAVLSNSIQAVPIMAKLAFKPLGTRGAVQPYLTGGAGVSLIGFKQYLGEFGSADNSASFAAQAGAGVFIPFGKLSAAGLSLGANYNYVPYNKNGFGNMNTLDLHAGIYFPLR